MEYDLRTQALMKEIKMLDESFDKGILPKLALLEKTATALKDDYLLGFTYYYYSFASYYFDKERKNFTHYLSLAVHYLMKVEDHEMLARVFNLVAIDTFSYGSYDVAYNYYVNALHEAEADGSEVFMTVIETNISLLFLELKDYKKAKEHIERAIKIISKFREGYVQPFSLQAAYVDEAAINLELEKYTAAKKSLDKAVSIFPESNAPDEDLKLSITLIKYRLACEEKNKNEKQLFKDLLTYLKEEQYPDGYMSDIRHLCNYLLKNNKYEEVESVIKIINDGIFASGRVHIIQMFTTLKVNYALVTNKNLKQALAEQQYYRNTYRSNLNKIHNYTMELVEINNTIRKEQQENRKERIRLEDKAYHDALTGLANRRMLNKLLASSFESAYHNKTMLGIELLDIDCFKNYNDTYGHLEGDKCLIAIARELERICDMKLKDSATIYCGRYGGDEFVIIYEDLDKKRILSLAKSIKEQIEDLAIKHEGNPKGGFITLSQGICIGIPEEKQRIWDYLSQADVAMYKVKKARYTKHPKKDGICLTNIEAFDANRSE